MKSNHNPFVAAHVRNLFVIATVAISLACPTARAASFYWDADPVTAENQNGDGIWNSSNTNWTANAAVGDADPNISWASAAGNTAFLGSTVVGAYTNPAIGGIITLGETIGLTSLSMSSAQTGAYIINGGAGITLDLVGTAPSLANNSAAPLTVNAVVSGAAGLAKSNAGRVILTGINTYTGNTTLNGGALEVGDFSGQSLGVGGILFNSGVIQGKGTFTRNFNTTNANTAADGEIAGKSGGFAAKGGALTVNFGGAGASVSLSDPSYRLGLNFALGSATADSKVTVVNPINLNGSVRIFTVTPGTGGDSAELSGILSNGTGGISKAGTGLLLLSNSNTYGGNTLVTAGMLVISNGNALGTAAAGSPNITAVSTAASLQLTNGIVTDINEPLTISGTGSTNVGALQAGTGGGTWAGSITLGATGSTSARIGATTGNTLTVTGAILNGINTNLSISGGSGTGVVVLKPDVANTYSGQTTIIRGILRLGKNDALPVTTLLDVRDLTTITDTSSFDMAGFNQTLVGLIDTTTVPTETVTNSLVATTSTLTINNTAARTFDGIVQDGAGTVAIVKEGTSTQTFTGPNNYSGSTLINVGALSISNNTGLGNTTGTTTVAATGTTTTGGRLIVNNNIVCAESITLTGNTEQAGGYNPSIDSTSGINELSGAITLAGTGGQRIAATTGTLTLSGPIARDGANAGALVLRTGATDAMVAVNNTIDLNGSGVNIQGLGTVVLNQASTDMTSATISFGGALLTLKLGVDNALPVAADLTIGTTNVAVDADKGTFDLAGFNQSVNSLSAIAAASDSSFRKITNSGGTLSTLTAGNGDGGGFFDGVIEQGTGDIAITKVGTGTITLMGANTYTGATTISAGTLALVGGNQASPITVDTNAFLGFTLGSPTTSTAAVNLTAGKVKITGTPILSIYTLMTASSITGTPVLDAPIAGYMLTVVGGNQLVLNATGGGNTYADWLSANSPATGFVSDTDNDGVPNGVENVLGTNPNAYSAGLTQVSATPGSATFQHTLNPTIASDVSYSYQWSTDMIEWKASGETNTGNTKATISPSAPAAGVVTVTTTIISGPAGKIFTRIKVSNP